jgi:hypothetical protein
VSGRVMTESIIAKRLSGIPPCLLLFEVSPQLHLARWTLEGVPRAE